MKNQVAEKSRLFRSLLIVLFVVGLFPFFYFASVEIGIAQVAANESRVEASSDDLFDRYVENVAFGVGEKLNFEIKYGFISAGTASMEVSRLVEYQNRPCYQIVTTAQSNSFFSSFFRVDDRVESIVDALGIFSWRFEKELNEGKYHAFRMYEFDQRTNLVYYGDDTISVPPFVQDPLSALYWIRTQELKAGNSVAMDNFADGRQTALEMRVLKKETITVKAGTFDCVVVEPLSNSVGVFKHDGRLKVWLTDDRLKMPVLMKSKVLVGSISAELTDFKLGEIEIF